MLIFVVLLTLLIVADSIVLEESIFSPAYSVGVFYTTQTPSLPQLRQLLDYCLQDQRQYTDLLLHRWEKNRGRTLLELGRSVAAEGEAERDLALANQLNVCKAPSPSSLSSSNEQFLFNLEIVFQFGMVAYSQNYASAKNFAFVLEYTGYFQAAKSVFHDCHVLTGDVGCLLHYIMSVPILPYSQAQTDLVYVEMLRSFFHFLIHVKAEADFSASQHDFVYNTLREIPINTHYLGFSPGRIFHLFSESIYKYYPAIAQVRVEAKAVRSSNLLHVLRLGIVSGKPYFSFLSRVKQTLTYCCTPP